MIKLQRCLDCGTVQYPPRETCAACLSDRLGWDSAESMPARVLARTRLHHSNEERFKTRLPLVCGLVKFDAGPVAVCYLAETALPGDAIAVRLDEDGLLHA